MSIKEQEASLEENLTAIYESAGSDKKSDYQALIDDYRHFKGYMSMLVANSANSNNAEAYRLANEEVAQYEKAMETTISDLSDNATSQADSRKSTLTGTYRVSSLISMVIALLCIATVLVVIIVVFRAVIQPLMRADRELRAITKGIDEGHGDLTARLTEGSRDEVGSLAHGVNRFLSRLQKIFTMITNDSTKMEGHQPD